MPVIFFRALLKLPHTLGQNARDFFSSPLWTPVVKKTVVRHPLAKTRWHPLAPVGTRWQKPVGTRWQKNRWRHPLKASVDTHCGHPLRTPVLNFRLAVTPKGSVDHPRTPLSNPRTLRFPPGIDPLENKSTF